MKWKWEKLTLKCWGRRVVLVLGALAIGTGWPGCNVGCGFVGAHIWSEDYMADDDAADDDTADDDDNGDDDDDDYTEPDPGAVFVDIVVAGDADPQWADLFIDNPATTDDWLAPVIAYPQDQTGWPGNWPSSTFWWVPSGSGSPTNNLFWIQVEVPGQIYPLRVLTTETTWEADNITWGNLAAASPQEIIDVWVYGAEVDLDTGTLLSGPYVASVPNEVSFHSFAAPGRIIYWTTSDMALHRIELGQTTDHYFYGPSNNPTGACEGCHSGTPDGNFIASSTSTFECDGCSYYVSLFRTEDLTTLSGLHPDAATYLATPDSTLPVFSDAYWVANDQRMVFIRDKRLRSLDLLTGEYKQLEVTGDPDYQALPSWSPNGETVVYVSSPKVVNGRTDDEACDIYSVPYNDGDGGTATPFPGASDPAIQEYYPDISPDDEWLAFNRCSGDTYAAPDAEIFVMSMQGGSAHRIVGNDPPTILGETSPGLTNSWPKWAPEYVTSGDDTWLFLAFSSTRHFGMAQVWVSLVRVNGGQLTSYPALHLPGQDTTTDNHTPVWFRDKVNQ